MGFPGYSALYPNPMLSNSLVLVRDMLTSGTVGLSLSGSGSDKSGLPVWTDKNSAESATALPASGEKAHKQTWSRIQPNVRAALAEMELLECLRFGVDNAGATGTRSAYMQLLLATDKESLMRVPVVRLDAPNRKQFIQQLDTVFSFAELRAERSGEILSQAVPQTSYWSAIAGLTPERHRHTLELLGIGLRFAMMVVMRFKFLLNCPRPIEYSPLVQPIILTPGYSAFPSGHATEGYFAAELLAALAQTDGNEPLLLGDQELAAPTPNSSLAANLTSPHKNPAAAGLRGQLHRLAYRVAENRVVAGLHFPVDSMAGQLLGLALARYFVWSCTVASARSKVNRLWRDTSFGPLAGQDLEGKAMPRLDAAFGEPFMTAGKPAEVDEKHERKRPILSELWREALDECKAAHGHKPSD
jgi:hypothetical protein